MLKVFAGRIRCGYSSALIDSADHTSPRIDEQRTMPDNQHAIIRPRLGSAACVLVGIAFALSVCRCSTSASAETTISSFFEEEIARFTRLAESDIAEYQIEAAQGFYYLEHHRAEPVLLKLIDHPDPAVRLQVVKALGVCGRRESVEALIRALADPDWEVRINAEDALERMTADNAISDRREGTIWLGRSSWEEKEAELVRQLTDQNADRALAALVALRYVGTSTSEDAVLANGPRTGRDAPTPTVKTLERIGTQKSLPGLIALCPAIPAASWALAEIGGEGAEDVLLASLARWRSYRLDYMLNLDRIGSTKCREHTPMMLRAFGLVIYRGQTDDLQFGATAYQRAAGNLILRTGRAQEIVDLILAECENSRNDEQTPPILRQTLADMRPELAPGFVRNDGGTVAQPLAALPHIIRDQRFVPRLVSLLHHPAYIVRIYAAESLAALGAEEGVKPISTGPNARPAR